KEGNILNIRNPKFQNLTEESSPEFFKLVQKKNTFTLIVEKLPDSNFKKMLMNRNLIAALIVPIIHNGQLIGYLGVDSNNSVDNWDDFTISAVETLANNMAVSIIKIKNQDALLESEEKFKLLANNIPGAVY